MLLKTSPALPLRMAQEHLSADELCAGTLVAVAGNQGVGPLSLAANTARQHCPRGTASGSLKQRFSLGAGVDRGLGSEGRGDQAQISR